jgi:hypothetical protein
VTLAGVGAAAHHERFGVYDKTPIGLGLSIPSRTRFIMKFVLGYFGFTLGFAQAFSLQSVGRSSSKTTTHLRMDSEGHDEKPVLNKYSR